MNKFAQTLTSDNAVLAMIDHQTGLLVSCRDQDPHLTKANIRGLCTMANIVEMPSVVRDVSMHRMTQAGVKVSTWGSILAEVMKDWRSPKGLELGGVLGEHTSYNWVYHSFLAASVAQK